MRKSWGAAGAAGVMLVAGAVLMPAAALAATDGPSATGPTVGTSTTFDVTSGLLTITAPDDASLGSGAPGTIITGSLGAVTVNDNRALLAASWTATASSADFTTGAGTTLETIPATDVDYTVGDITTTGTITATGTDLTPMSNAAQTVVTGSAGSGDNSASWTPTLAVHVPDTAVGGIYTAIVTHSVA